MPRRAIGTIGQISQVYQPETPWKKIGVHFPTPVSVEHALREAHLDWTVRTEPQFLANGTETEQVAVLRSDNDHILGYGTKGSYGLLQNSAAFAPFADVGCVIKAAWQVKDGARVGMLADLGQDALIEPRKGDIVRGFMRIGTSHDGSTGHEVDLELMRLVCTNGLQRPEHLTLFRYRHTSGIALRVEQVREAIKRTLEVLRQTEKLYAKMAEREVSKATIAQFIDDLFPEGEKPSQKTLDRRATVAHLVWNGRGAQLAGVSETGATAWAVYNAVTEYVDHVRPAEAQKATAKASANESALFGANAALKALALRKARELVAV